MKRSLGYIIGLQLVMMLLAGCGGTSSGSSSSSASSSSSVVSSSSSSSSSVGSSSSSSSASSSSSSSSSSVSVILGVQYSGSVYQIVPGTGVGTLVGATGFTNLNAMARNSSGALFTVGSPSVTPTATPRLISIDPQTGVGTSVATLWSSADLRGLAFSANDVLYGVQNTVAGSIAADDLYTINVTTGAGTRIGTTGVSGLQALEFSPSGQLYGWNIPNGLVTLNPNTGLATAVSSTVTGINMQTLAFDSAGNMYGVGNTTTSLPYKLWSIDPNTGVATAIGSSTVTDIRGIEFISAPSGSGSGSYGSMTVVGSGGTSTFTPAGGLLAPIVTQVDPTCLTVGAVVTCTSQMNITWYSQGSTLPFVNLSLQSVTHTAPGNPPGTGVNGISVTYQSDLNSSFGMGCRDDGGTTCITADLHVSWDLNAHTVTFSGTTLPANTLTSATGQVVLTGILRYQ